MISGHLDNKVKTVEDILHGPVNDNLNLLSQNSETVEAGFASLMAIANSALSSGPIGGTADVQNYDISSNTGQPDPMQQPGQDAWTNYRTTSQTLNPFAMASGNRPAPVNAPACMVLRLRCHRHFRLQMCSRLFRSSRLKLFEPLGILSQPPTLALLHRYAGQQLQAHSHSNIRLREILMLV